MKLIESDYNPVTGLTHEYWLHPNNKTVTVRRFQDVEPIFDNNRRELNAKSAKASKLGREGLGTRVASIPMGLVEKLAKEKGLNVITCSTADLHRLINDPDFAKIRTAHGRV